MCSGQTSVSSDETRRTLASRRQRHMDRIETLTEMRVNRELEADSYLKRRDVELSAIERIDAELATLPEPLPLPMYRAGALAIRDAAAAIAGASDDELRRLVAILGARAFVDNRTRAVRWIFAAPYNDLMPG